jgi:zinc transporter, ZIP family
MAAAAFWAFVGAGAMLVGALLAFWFAISDRVLGLVMAFGAGTLLSAVSFDLVLESYKVASGSAVFVGLVAGAVTFIVGDLLLARMTGATPADDDAPAATIAPTPLTEPPEQGSGVSLALGATLDGVPESVAIALTLLGGGTVSGAVVLAVFLSNVPEGMAASIPLHRGGMSKARILLMWSAVVAVCVVAAVAGYVLLTDAPPATIAVIQSFAAGAILTMLANTLMPEAYRNGGRAVGFVTVVGFILASGLAAH